LTTRGSTNDVGVLLRTRDGGLASRNAPAVHPQLRLTLQGSHDKSGLADSRLCVSTRNGGELCPCRFWVLNVPGNGTTHLKTVNIIISDRSRRTIRSGLYTSCQPECREKVGIGIGHARGIATASCTESSWWNIACDIGNVIPELPSERVFLFRLSAKLLKRSTPTSVHIGGHLPTRRKVRLAGLDRRKLGNRSGYRSVSDTGYN
jgi:hypothetical protein